MNEREKSILHIYVLPRELRIVDGQVQGPRSHPSMTLLVFDPLTLIMAPSAGSASPW